MNSHTGGCHCGAVRYEVDAVMDSAMECNCSHCGKKGFLLKFVPKDAFRLTSGDEGALTEYRFNKKHISHRFCPTCGVQTHGHGTGPDGAEMTMINVRTLDEAPESIEITTFDGKTL